MVTIKGTVFFLVILGLNFTCADDNGNDKRPFYPPPPLVNPFGATFKLIVGYAMPVQLSGRILVYGQNFQFQYPMPPNATFFTNFFHDTSRRRRKSLLSDERIILYKLLEDDLRRKGIDGESCMKHDICEAATAPVKDEGLVGEFLHLLLTPDYGNTSRMGQEYLQAAEVGRQKQNCREIYKCPPGEGMLDKISHMFFT